MDIELIRHASQANILVCPAQASPLVWNAGKLHQRSLFKSPLADDWIPPRLKLIDFGMAERCVDADGRP